MSEAQDLSKVLLQWKDNSGKVITNALQRINATKLYQGQDLQLIDKTVNSFHKEIVKADQQEIDVKWFSLCIQSKKKLKKMLQKAQKLKKKTPALQKKSSTLLVIYPEALTEGRGPNDERILKFLFKGFVTNFQEAMTMQKTVQFISLAVKELKRKYGDLPDEVMNKKVLSISNRLSRQSSRQSKQRMLNGQITAFDLAKDSEQIYFDQKTRDNIAKIQREELERNSTGFYDEMKKKINKDACQQCKYCHQRAAYCEDQKQIRASDQPMTRFMRCNKCEKAWRD